jgi:ribosome recycling factor
MTMEKYNNFQNDLKDVVVWMQKEMKQISAGGVTPAILDSVMVESYGSFMQVQHLAAIGIDGNSLKVSPFDKSQTKAIEQAIRDADLGVSLVTESDGVRVIFPQLTTETRAKYVKIAKEKLEDARIKVRQLRSDVNSDLDALKINGEISEDDNKKKKDQVQEMVDKTNAELESMFKHKESAILNI